MDFGFGESVPPARELARPDKIIMLGQNAQEHGRSSARQARRVKTTNKKSTRR